MNLELLHHRLKCHLAQLRLDYQKEYDKVAETMQKVHYEKRKKRMMALLTKVAANHFGRECNFGHHWQMKVLWDEDHNRPMLRILSYHHVLDCLRGGGCATAKKHVFLKKDQPSDL